MKRLGPITFTFAFSHGCICTMLLRVMIRHTFYFGSRFCKCMKSVSSDFSPPAVRQLGIVFTLHWLRNRRYTIVIGQFTQGLCSQRRKINAQTALRPCWSLTALLHTRVLDICIRSLTGGSSRPSTVFLTDLSFTRFWLFHLSGSNLPVKIIIVFIVFALF